MKSTIETREVLAGAYRKRSGRMLSHAALVDPYGNVAEVLCGRVDPLNLADSYAQDVRLPPTCPVCVSRLKARERAAKERP